MMTSRLRATLFSRRSTPSSDLKRWHDAMRDIHQAAPDLVFTYIDDKKNRIALGVEDPERHRAAVEAELDRLGIPREGVNIEQSTPIALSLQQRDRPLVGGLQIQFQEGFLGVETESDSQ